MKRHSLDTVRKTLLALGSMVALGAAAPAMARCDFGKDARLVVSGAKLTVNGVRDNRPVTPWYELSSGGYIGGCTSGNIGHFRATGYGAVLGTYSEGRSIYSIYDTGIPGLGFVVALRDQARRDGIDYQPVQAGKETHLTFDDWLTLDLRLRFIKVGEIDAADNRSIPEIGIADFRLTDATSVGTGARVVLAGTTIDTIHRALCHPRNTTVNMGRAFKAEFTGRYSRSPARTFDISLDCEAKVGDVQYYLEETASSPLIHRAMGLVEVTGGASGVALQMSEVGGTPITFDTPRPFGHGGDAAGVLRRTFEARYVQTVGSASDIVTGDADASITIVMAYP